MYLNKNILNNKTIILDKEAPHPILCDISFPPSAIKMPLVIFCHGFKGFKDWGAWKLALDEIAQRANCYTVRFNFSMNGTTIDNPSAFVDLEAFGNNTYSQEQRDLEKVIDFFSKVDEVSGQPIILIGHSRGGGGVILQGYHNPLVSAVVTLGGVSDFRKRFPHNSRFTNWEQDGVFYVENKRTMQQLPQYFSFWLDYIENEKTLNVQHAAQHLRKPTLIIHGDEDESVHVKEAELLHQWIEGSDLQIIEGANHVLGAKHPYMDKILPKDLDKAVELIALFIKNI